jgi:hypothetical protein
MAKMATVEGAVGGDSVTTSWWRHVWERGGVGEIFLSSLYFLRKGFTV